MLHTIGNSSFRLLTQKAMYWQEEHALILSDVHIGKTQHFRKSGVPIPSSAAYSELDKLNRLLTDIKADKLIIVGDLFHSKHNVEIDVFEVWRVQYPNIAFHLIKGNHDILPLQRYHEIGVEVHTSQFTIGDIIFAHELPQVTEQDKYYITGHIHPGVKIRGAGKQHLRLPCFYFSNTFAILPSFGKFTGLAEVKILPGDEVYVITEKEVIKLT
jgi:DNA ligase-associated metallophosphoesterase